MGDGLFFQSQGQQYAPESTGRQLERILRVPWSLAKALFLRAKSMFLRREGVKSGSPADEAEGKGDKSSANKKGDAR